MDDMTLITQADGMDEDIDLTPREELVVQSVATCIMCDLMMYLKNETTIPEIIRESESRAIEALTEIAQVLNNKEYSDRECLYQIDAIIDILSEQGIFIGRHSE